jgi:uncharacterized SAM-binding protein YcdF (DUF218 family)
MIIRRRTTALLLVAAAAFLLWAARVPLLRAAGRWLDVGVPPSRVDYIMVLNGDEQTRPFAAAALRKAHWASRVLVAEVAPSPMIEDRILSPEHEINRQVLLHRGVPAEDIQILPGQAETTRDEARALASFLQSRPGARALVVTSDYHSRRSRWIFALALGDRATSVAFVSAPTDGFDVDRWWQNPWGFLAVGSEYLKLAFYAVRYGNAVPWAASLLALLAIVALAKSRAGQGAQTLGGAAQTDQP